MICPVCQSDFEPKRKGVRPGQDGISCSHKCKGILRQSRASTWVGCQLCGVLFMIPKCWIKKGGGKYCSARHRDMAKVVRIYKRYCGICGKVFYRKVGEYCSRKCSGEATRQRQLGEKSHLWKGGITAKNTIIRESAEYAEWRNSVFSRDNWICQDCGMRGATLHAHHVFEFAQFEEHRFDVWNGVTLCVDCHINYHPKLAALWGINSA